MNENVFIIIAIVLAVILRILLKNGYEFILPKIVVNSEGKTKFELNSLGTILISLIAVLTIYQATPEGFITPAAAFLTAYGSNSIIENIGTKIMPNKEQDNAS